MIIQSRGLINSLRKCVPIIAMIGCWCIAVFATNNLQVVPQVVDTQLTDEIQLVSTASIPETPQVEEHSLVVQPTVRPIYVMAIDQMPTMSNMIKMGDADVDLQAMSNFNDAVFSVGSTLMFAEAVGELKKEINKEDEEEIDSEQTPTSDGFIYVKEIPLSKELQKYTYDTCVEKDLRYTMVLAVMKRESGFQVNATHYNKNGTMDSGLMQLNDVMRPFLKDQYGVVNFMDPYENIRGGTSFIRYLLDKYDERSAMMAYQYGEGGMAAKHRQGIYTSEAVEKMYRFEAEIIQLIENAGLYM